MIRKPRIPLNKTTLFQFDSQYFETAFGHTPVQESCLFLGSSDDFSDSFKIIVRKILGAAEDNSYFAFAMDMQRMSSLMLLKMIFIFPVDYY